jgi:hypothetical protein
MVSVSGMANVAGLSRAVLSVASEVHAGCKPESNAGTNRRGGWWNDENTYGSQPSSL